MKCHASAEVGSSLVLVLLLLLVVLLQGSPVVFSAPNVPFVSRLGQEVGDLLAPCLAQNASGPWDCLKAESLASVERLAQAPRITLLAGVSLVRTSADVPEPREADQGIRTGLAWRHSVLESLRRLLESHMLELDLGPVCGERRGTSWPRQVLTVRFGDQELSTHASAGPDRVEGRHRRRQQMIPMMIFGVTVFGMFIVPIAFQFLTALSGKAFLMAKLALLLASINGLKRVASTGVHYGLYHAVDQFPAGPHHVPPPLHHPFGPGPMLYERTDGLGYAEGPRAWHAARRSFELEQSAPSQEKSHLVTDCMHVTSEAGEFSFVKLPATRSTSKHGHWAVEADASAPSSPDGSAEAPAAPDAATVCGIYFVADPDQIIEVTMRQVNVDCRSGGLMAFVDGWELNGQYFPGERDHEKPLALRVQEFCAERADAGPWRAATKPAPAPSAWVFRSSQNAALVQYRIPVRGSFVLSARFLRNAKPCHIMAEGLAPYYMLRNYGQRRNCTLTALFPAVVSVVALEVGGINENVRYCERVHVEDKLEVGGSPGLDPAHQAVLASTICGRSGGRMDLEQTILCGSTTVRLVSSGRYNNQAMVTMRMADESDLRLATAMCEM